MAHGGKVLIGEGSDSDDDVDVPQVSCQETSSSKWIPAFPKKSGINASIKVNIPTKRTNVILGEASESEEEEIVTDHGLAKVETNANKPIPIRESSTPIHEKKVKFQYNSLLHKKLREKNVVLGRRIAAAARQPYVAMIKEINSVTHNLVKSQSEIQEVGPILRQINMNLTFLEEKLDITNDFTYSIPSISCETPSSSNSATKR